MHKHAVKHISQVDDQTYRLTGTQNLGDTDARTEAWDIKKPSNTFNMRMHRHLNTDIKDPKTKAEVKNIESWAHPEVEHTSSSIERLIGYDIRMNRERDTETQRTTSIQILDHNTQRKPQTLKQRNTGTYKL